MSQGRGCIYIPHNILPPGVEIWRTGYIIEGPTFEQWLSYVELPRQYVVKCLYIDTEFRQWVMVVAGDTLPVPTLHQKVSRLAVEFERTTRGVRVVGRR